MIRQSEPNPASIAEFGLGLGLAWDPARLRTRHPEPSCRDGVWPRNGTSNTHDGSKRVLFPKLSGPGVRLRNLCRGLLLRRHRRRYGLLGEPGAQVQQTGRQFVGP